MKTTSVTISCENFLQDIGNILNQIPDIGDLDFKPDTIIGSNKTYVDTNVPNTAVTLSNEVSTSKDSFVVVAPSWNSTELPSLSSLQEPTVTSQKPKRCRTEEEKSERNAAKHPLLPSGKDGCIKCKIRLPSDHRAIINFRFWKLSFTERRQSLSTHVNQIDVKQRKVESN